jgi:hypothetical protein
MVDALRCIRRDGGGREVDTEDDSGPAIGMTGARFGGAPRRKRSARRKAAKANADVPQAVPPENLPPEKSTDPPEPDTAVIPVATPDADRQANHHPGARQHGAPAGDAIAPGEPAPAAEAPDAPVVGLTGARFGGARKKRKPSPAPRPAATPTPADPPQPAAPPVPEVEEPVAGGSAFVRPYVYTRGRTRSSFELSIETLVSAAAAAAPPGLNAAHHAVLGLCREPRSVAELAARAGVPLGVARVLVGDLAAAGAVAVHRSVGAAGPDLALMQRVLSGLKKL